MVSFWPACTARFGVWGVGGGVWERSFVCLCSHPLLPKTHSPIHYISVSHFLQYREFPSAVRCEPVRVGLAQLGQTTCRFESLIGASPSSTAPGTFFCGFGLVCFFIMLARSTRAVPFVALTRRTLPCLPRSLPVRMRTVSFFLTCGLTRTISFCFVGFPYICVAPLDDFRRERDDLHELPLAQLAGDRAENARADRLACVVDENGRVVVEFDVRTVAAAALFHGPNDNGLDHRALLDGAVRRGFLDRGRDHVAEARVLACGRTAEHLDAGDLLCAGVVGHLKDRSHLNHCRFSMRLPSCPVAELPFVIGQLGTLATW